MSYVQSFRNEGGSASVSAKHKLLERITSLNHSDLVWFARIYKDRMGHSIQEAFSDEQDIYNAIADLGLY